MSPFPRAPDDDMAVQPDIDSLDTLVTPVRTDASRLVLRAAHFSESLDLEAIRQQFSPSQILPVESLVLNLATNSYVAIFPFGAVVFWHCDEALIGSILSQVRQASNIESPPHASPDQFGVQLGEPEERVSRRGVYLPALTVEHVKIISEAFGQSVALQQSELLVGTALKATTPIVQALQTRGELLPTAKELLRTVGFTLGVRESILARLSLLDPPPETRRSERLSRLYEQLQDRFQLRSRVAGLQEKIGFLSDLNQLLMTLLQNRTSHRLEWTVILLIVIEVIYSTVHFFSGAH